MAPDDAAQMAQQTATQRIGSGRRAKGIQAAEQPSFRNSLIH